MSDPARVLRALGWDAQWDEARRACDASGELTPVRIAAEHRGAYHAAGIGGTAWVELTGKTFHRARDKRTLPTVGDWVLVTRWAEALAANGAGVVQHVLPRRGLLVRKAAGEAIAPQPVAANVDVGLVMTSANRDRSPARLDRYLALLAAGGVAPVIVLSKVDLVGGSAPEAKIAAIIEELNQRAPEVIAVSSVSGAGVAAIRARVGDGKTAVLLGSSGVGKSTLLNALLGADAQRTQPIRSDERGRHTTTRRELFVTADGAWIDTPGMRELGRWVGDDDDGDTFDDITALAGGCKFADCTHTAEPGCAVRAAVAAGTLPAPRLASFHKLGAERTTGAADQKTARRLVESRRAKVKKYAPRPGKRDED